MFHAKSGVRRCFLGCLTAVTVLATPALFGYGGRDRQRPEREENPRLQQLQEEIRTSAAQVQTTLKSILDQVNDNMTPDDALIKQAATLLEDNKRYAPRYDDPQKAQYMLLQAWADYYQGQPLGAMNWALRACKTDESSRDAWISQAVFCLINGKRPLEPRIQRPDTRQDRNNGLNRRPRRRANVEEESNGYASPSQPYGQQGTLTFELAALRTDMLNERFGRTEFKAASGSIIGYQPGQDTLCVLFRQDGQAVSDANDLPGGRPVQQAARTLLEEVGYTLNAQSLTPEKQADYFDRLYRASQGHSAIKCFQINTASRPEAAPASDEKAPVVLAADQGAGARNFAGLDAENPFMLIADEKGVVRYAGPAADFMPAFILTHVTGVQIPLNGPNAANPNQRIRPGDRLMIPGPRDIRRTLQPDPNRSPADPNGPAVDPNSLGSAVERLTPRTPRPAEPVQMTLEDQVRADKLLAQAELAIDGSRTIRGKSPEPGIEACKEILEKYPGTEYAERARGWLRRVPPRYWEKYDIADLLGY